MAVIDGFLPQASGCWFYNTSCFTFDLLLSDPDNIEASFRDYLAGFFANVQDLLAKCDFDNIIKRMAECNSLYLIASPKGYLGPDKINAVDCWCIFEDLVKRFSESVQFWKQKVPLNFPRNWQPNPLQGFDLNRTPFGHAVKQIRHIPEGDSAAPQICAFCFFSKEL